MHRFLEARFEEPSPVSVVSVRILHDFLRVRCRSKSVLSYMGGSLVASRSWVKAHSPYWSLHVEAWRQSGMARADYCRQLLGGFPDTNLDRASAAHPKCCCASRIADALLERQQLRLIVCCSFRKEECCSMSVHIDRKRLDGNAIAFVMIMLLIVIAFAY
jgi:hypothetical protein